MEAAKIVNTLFMRFSQFISVGKLAMVATSSAGKAGGEAPAAEGAGLRIKRPGAGKSRLAADAAMRLISSSGVSELVCPGAAPSTGKLGGLIDAAGRMKH